MIKLFCPRKFVHKYPKVHFTKVRVDSGAIPFVLGGANIMVSLHPRSACPFFLLLRISRMVRPRSE